MYALIPFHNIAHGTECTRHSSAQTYKLCAFGEFSSLMCVCVTVFEHAWADFACLKVRWQQKLHPEIPKQIFTYNPCVCARVFAKRDSTTKLNLSQKNTTHTSKYKSTTKRNNNKNTKGSKERILIEIISGILINNMSHKNMLQNILIGFVLYTFSSASHIFLPCAQGIRYKG